MKIKNSYPVLLAKVQIKTLLSISQNNEGTAKITLSKEDIDSKIKGAKANRNTRMYEA